MDFVTKSFSERWNSDQLTTFTTYLSSLLGVIAIVLSNHVQKWGQILVMSLSQAGSSHSSSWRIFGSARGPFPLSSKKKSARKLVNWQFWALKFFFSYFTCIFHFDHSIFRTFLYWILIFVSKWLIFWFRNW